MLEGQPYEEEVDEEDNESMKEDVEVVPSRGRDGANNPESFCVSDYRY